MGKDSDIVEILREEEKKGLLNSNNSTYEESKTDDLEESYKVDIDFKKTYGDNSNLTKELLEIQDKYNKTKEKLIESYERYNSLYEYFEIISDTTITLSKKDLFSDVSDIIFQVTPKGRITYINSAVEKLLGYSSSGLIGEHFTKIVDSEDWKKIHKNFFSGITKKAMTDRDLSSFETNLVTKDGNKIPVEINGKLMRYNVEVVGRANDFRIQGSIRDITERKKAEAERIKHEQELEAINSELNAANSELKKAQHELEEFNRNLEKKVDERTKEIQKLLKHKDEFIGQLGHDLKSPLTPLVGLLPTIEREEKDPKQKELLGVVNRNVLYMRDLVVKTLKLARLNLPTLQLNIEEFDLNEVVSKIILNKEYFYKDKNLKIVNNIDKGLSIFADKLEVNELIDNLFTNSIKFTPENGKIIFDAKKDKNCVKVSVSDTGIGLSSDQIRHVFEEFYKVDPSRHDLGASGLGLTICKRILEQHEGDIWVESPGINKGTTFYFTIPVK